MQKQDTTNFASQTAAPKNYLLEALPAADFRRIEQLLEPISLKLGESLYEPNKRTEYAYFPTSAIVSLFYVMENGAAVAVNIVGKDGMLGIAPLFEAETMSNEAIVQCAGEAFRMKNQQLQKEFKQNEAVRKVFLRYAMALLEHTSQIAACNRLHSIEKQLCRWLLLTHDRLDSDTLVITQDLISNILGVSRESVTLAAKKLKERKLIEPVRGNFTIIDRQGLESVACECYRRINNDYRRLFDRDISKTVKPSLETYRSPATAE
jgi:CRP-like cAMP-binding protein